MLETTIKETQTEGKTMDLLACGVAPVCHCLYLVVNGFEGK